MSEQAKFMVTNECLPGVARAHYGLIKPGRIFYWPAQPIEGDNPSLKLRPLNKEAYDLLISTHEASEVKAKWGVWEGEKVAEKKGRKEFEPPNDEPGKAQKEDKKSKGRLADSK